MKPSLYPDWIEGIWAKSPDKGEGGSAESLAQHTWAVMSRLAEFIHLRPRLPEEIGHPDLWHILFWAAFFHDFGKSVPDFQGVLHGDSKARERWGGNRHEVFSLAFLGWVVGGLNTEQMDWLIAAVASHHRDPADLNTLYPLPLDDEPDPLSRSLNGLKEADILGLWHWLSECSWKWAAELGLDQLGVSPLKLISEHDAVRHIQEQGTPQIRVALRRYRRLVRSLEGSEMSTWINGVALRGHLINADHGGSAHVDPLPIPGFTKQNVYEKCAVRPDRLYLHQQEAAQADQCALLIAPTGSGKTEAALLWASQQQNNGTPAPRLFYTLPYQASMNAMRLRLEEVFGTQNVSLQHGRGLLALYRQLMERSYTPASAIYTARQMRNLAALNHPPVRIFSPYQILKGMYRLKGYEAQLTDYHNALFVFDEIHAYEVKRLGMILRTMSYLYQHYHARFFVMSATFPSLIKKWLVEALDSPIEIHAQPKLFAEFQRHQLHLLDGDLLAEESLAQIRAEAASGKSALVVCNTVGRAQEAYNALKSLQAQDIPVELLHGRFNLRDRGEKERFIREKAATRNTDRKPVVLVATQVVEVSLDIDLNTIYTDPAPLEALVQRFGRVNRGRKIKPFAPVYVFTQPDDGQKIYDSDLVRRTLQILHRENGRPIDESAVGNWLDEIYSGEVAERWQKEFTKSAKEFDEVCVRTLRPFETDPNLEELFYKAFDGVEVLPQDLLQEYMEVKDTNPILAGELVVPISWGRYHALINKGQLLPGDRAIPPVVIADYSKELGLSPEKTTSKDDWE